MPDIVSKEIIEELRARNEIAEVIGSYLELKRAGSALKALCPFHTEKTPSFNVNEDRQIYRCFGCGASGDVFTFVMEYEGVEFPAAMEILADRCGMRLQTEPRKGDQAPRGPQKDVLYKILEATTGFYQECLANHPEAKAARDYLSARQLDGEATERFQIGFAPEQRGALTSWAQQKKWSSKELEGAGLIARSDNGRGSTYERFRGRIMFPITDIRGRVVGYSGRILDNQSNLAKYVNSPETPVFSKSSILFGLDKARANIGEKGYAVICEGQIDAIRCHLAGLEHVVASQGTAMGEKHAALMNRFTDTVVLLMDADSAGQKAAIRSADVFLSRNMDVRIAALPPGEDPDSLILGQGAEALTACVENAKSVVDFHADRIVTDPSVFKEDQRKFVAVEAILESIGKVPRAVKQDEMLRKVSRRFLIDERHLREDLRRITSNQRPARDSKPTVKPMDEKQPTSEICLLELMMVGEEVVELVRSYLPFHCMSSVECREVARVLVENSEATPENLTSFLANSGENCIRVATAARAAPNRLIGEDALLDDTAKDFILQIRRNDLERRKKDLHQRTLAAKGAELEELVAARGLLANDIYKLRQGWDEALPILELES